MIPEWLETWLAAQTALDVVLWVVALTTGIGGVVLLVKRILPAVRRFMHFLDDWFGEEARTGQPARPGVMERLQSMEETQTSQTETLSEVRHELFPNSGKSMRDRTDQTRHAVRHIAIYLGLDPDDIENTITKEKP